MNLEKVSTRLAYMLRHSRDPQYISLEGGWASVDQILSELRASYPQMNRDYLEQIVSADKKGRYTFDKTGTHIRANQGHSIPGVSVEMEQLTPPEYLYHGTATRFLQPILESGLKHMSRLFVHLSSVYDTAVNVGRRHGDPVVLMVHAGEMAEAGFVFYRSQNDVWQTKEVPEKYLSIK